MNNKENKALSSLVVELKELGLISDKSDKGSQMNEVSGTGGTITITAKSDKGSQMNEVSGTGGTITITTPTL